MSDPVVNSPPAREAQAEYMNTTTGFESPSAKVMPDAAVHSPKPEETVPHRPLLDLFETELSKLMKSQDTPSRDSTKVNDTKKFPQSIHVTQSPSHFSGSPLPLPTLFQTSLFTATDSRDAQTHNSGEVIARSVKMLLEGVGSLATSVATAHSELQQHIAVGSHSVSLERALQASTAAIDALRGVVPTHAVQMPQSTSTSGNHIDKGVHTEITSPRATGDDPLGAKEASFASPSSAAALAFCNSSGVPELRVGPELPEPMTKSRRREMRVRRILMRDLFEQLARILPNSARNKETKREVLCKGKPPSCLYTCIVLGR